MCRVGCCCWLVLIVCVGVGSCFICLFLVVWVCCGGRLFVWCLLCGVGVCSCLVFDGGFVGFVY